MKKGFRLLLLLCAVTMIFVLPTMAAEIVASGECGAQGSNVTWTLDSEGLLTLSGSGDTEYWYSPWHIYRFDIKKAIINDGVTNIGHYAFENCMNLIQITLSNSMTSIGTRAFWGCDSLSEITIPSNVTSIGDDAFTFCTGLSNVNVDINNQYFTAIDGVLFNKNCTELYLYPAQRNGDSYIVPDGVTIIKKYAFYYSDLSSIYLPDSLTSIETDAFGICSRMKSIRIPANVSYIEGGLFYSCRNLEEISVDAGNSYYTVVDGVLFDKNCTTLYAYPAKKKGTEYRIPDSVTCIEDYAFNDSSILTEITIPNGVTSIGYNAFYDCDNLLKITIPSSVRNIEQYAFVDCSKLSNVIFQGDVPAEWGIDGKIDIFFGSASDFTISYYEGASGWTTPTWTAPDGTVYNTVMLPREEPKPEIIASGECGNNATWTLDVNGLLTISGEGSIRGYETPPQAIREAPYRAYANQINALLIEDGIEHIGGFTFFALPLDSVSVADSVLSIGQYAFSSTPITEIELPDKLTSIGFETFSQCENLEEITIPSTVVSIQSNAFDACSALKKATFLGNAPQYFGNAFTNTTEDFTIYYYEGTTGWTTPTWTATDGTVYNTVMIPREKPSNTTVLTTNPDISHTLRDQTLTVTNKDACVVLYQDTNGQYQTIAAENNAYTVPTNVDKVEIHVKGDYDGDGNIEVDDALTLQKAILGKTEPETTPDPVCDVNRDGRITAIDLALIAAAALDKYQMTW